MGTAEVGSHCTSFSVPNGCVYRQLHANQQCTQAFTGSSVQTNKGRPTPRSRRFCLSVGATRCAITVHSTVGAFLCQHKTIVLHFDWVDQTSSNTLLALIESGSGSSCQAEWHPGTMHHQKVTAQVQCRAHGHTHWCGSASKANPTMLPAQQSTLAGMATSCPSPHSTRGNHELHKAAQQVKCSCTPTTTMPHAALATAQNHNDHGK